jgi:serine/threonine protein kinase
MHLPHQRPKPCPFFLALSSRIRIFRLFTFDVLKMQSLPQSWIGPLRERRTHAAPVLKGGLHINGLHPDFLSFIAVAQGLDSEFLPTTWEPARGELGGGTSGRVYQSYINNETSFAFKSPIISGSEVDEAIAFRALICEVLILRHPVIQQHMNIIELEGIAWQVIPNGPKALPVLVFPLAPYGTLWEYMEAELRPPAFDSRLKICLDIGSGLAIMHSCSTYSWIYRPLYPNTLHWLMAFIPDIIHGDVKPQNIVMFPQKGDDQAAVPKLIDFGYSCFGSTDSDPAVLPKSPPWHAPEYCEEPEDRRGHTTILGAKKMDIYSYGLLCYWILFWEGSGDKSRTEDPNSQPRGPKQCIEGINRAKKMIRDLKDAPGPTAILSRALSQIEGLDSNKSSALTEFFDAALSKNPEKRSHNWMSLLSLIGKASATR